MAFNRIALWVLALVLFLSSPDCAMGQELDLRPGLKAGAAVMTHAGQDAPSHLGYRSGITGGAFVQVRIGSTWSFQTELTYVQKGARGTHRGITVTWRQHHVEIPLLITYRLPSIGAIRPTLLGGPFVDFNLDAEVKARTSDRIEVRNPGNIRTTGAGLTVGAGTEVPSSFGVLMLDLRYELGLTDIEEFDEDFVRNQGVLLTVGLAF